MIPLEFSRVHNYIIIREWFCCRMRPSICGVGKDLNKVQYKHPRERHPRATGDADWKSCLVERMHILRSLLFLPNRSRRWNGPVRLQSQQKLHGIIRQAFLAMPMLCLYIPWQKIRRK